MEYMQKLSKEVKTIQTQVARMDKRGSKKKITFKKTRRMGASSMTPRNLENDFNREAEGGGALETDEVPPSQVIRGSNRSHRQPTPSAPRRTSVLDRVGRRLTEHDLRLKLEASNIQYGERAPAPRGATYSMTRGSGHSTQGPIGKDPHHSR